MKKISEPITPLPTTNRRVLYRCIADSEIICTWIPEQFSLSILQHTNLRLHSLRDAPNAVGPKSGVQDAPNSPPVALVASENLLDARLAPNGDAVFGFALNAPEPPHSRPPEEAGWMKCRHFLMRRTAMSSVQGYCPRRSRTKLD